MSSHPLEGTLETLEEILVVLGGGYLLREEKYLSVQENAWYLDYEAKDKIMKHFSCKL